MRHLLGICELSADDIAEILRVSKSFVEVAQRPNPKIKALRGKTVVNCFFEDSTRTRASFELAGKLLSADVVNFTANGSSLSKGESLRDTIEAFSAMGFDAIVVRHGSAGVPWQICQWTDKSIINAGDGAHEHPTQALLDCLTLQQHFGRERFDGVRIIIVGDFAHSRVGRSGALAYSALGAEVTVVGPPTMLPADLGLWPVTVSHDLDKVLTSADVILTLRPQKERVYEALFPTLDEYIIRYGITDERFARLDNHVVLIDPGPLLRGVQMADAVADSPRNLMSRQVANGVAVRMAVLCMVLQGELGD